MKIIVTNCFSGQRVFTIVRGLSSKNANKTPSESFANAISGKTTSTLKHKNRRPQNEQQLP
ncbi:MAG: hypothetical protein V4772_10475, partial [Pseudomonadota bacterium]